jgi:hypothetical protein
VTRAQRERAKRRYIAWANEVHAARRRGEDEDTVAEITRERDAAWAVWQAG